MFVVSTCAVRKSVGAMLLADPIDGRVGGLDAVAAPEVPDNADRPHVPRPTQVLNVSATSSGVLFGWSGGRTSGC